MYLLDGRSSGVKFRLTWSLVTFVGWLLTNIPLSVVKSRWSLMRGSFTRGSPVLTVCSVASVFVSARSSY